MFIVKGLIETYTPAALGVERLYELFADCCNKASESAAYIRKSFYTKQVEAADKLRNKMLRGLAKTVKAALLHYEASVQAAAVRVAIVLNYSGRLTHVDFAAKSGSINHLLGLLTGEYAADAALLEINGWIERLRDSNRAFIKLYGTRNDESADKTPLRFKDVRKETDPIYRAIIEYVEAEILLEGSESLESLKSFVRDLNVHADSCALTLAQRKGRSKSRRAKK
jgi:hypothetical protein